MMDSRPLTIEEALLNDLTLQRILGLIKRKTALPGGVYGYRGAGLHRETECQVLTLIFYNERADSRLRVLIQFRADDLGDSMRLDLRSVIHHSKIEVTAYMVFAPEDGPGEGRPK